MVSGVMMALSAGDPSPGTGYKTMSASTIPVFEPVKVEAPQLNLPVYQSKMTDIPEDLLRSLAKSKGVLDTVYITKTDTIREQVTKVKWKKVAAPYPVIERDTIRETHYYLATQSGMKEGPEGECIPVYEVHKVDELCPEIINSSVESSNESNSDVGE
jgi:hypothetical protein